MKTAKIINTHISKQALALAVLKTLDGVFTLTYVLVSGPVVTTISLINSK